VIAALLGQSLSRRGAGGALLAQVGAGASFAGGARVTLSITELLPHTTTGTIEDASPTVLVAPGLGAALAKAKPVDCHHHHDKPIEPGTRAVLVQGLPLAVTGGATGCGAILCDGAPTVLAGGPASSGSGSGCEGGSPVADAIQYAENLAGRVSSAIASVERGVALAEQKVEETITKVEGTVSGAVSAVTGALASVTSGGVLGALFGQQG
jgi:uncharacterized Zn-binding protein involved in type VI secretion